MGALPGLPSCLPTGTSMTGPDLPMSSPMCEWLSSVPLSSVLLVPVIRGLHYALYLIHDPKRPRFTWIWRLDFVPTGRRWQGADNEMNVCRSIEHTRDRGWLGRRVRFGTDRRTKEVF